MKTYKITKNGSTLEQGLTLENAHDKFFCIVEEFSNGNYIYDNETCTIISAVHGFTVAKEGATIVIAGDNTFEIVEE